MYLQFAQVGKWPKKARVKAKNGVRTDAEQTGPKTNKKQDNHKSTNIKEDSVAEHTKTTNVLLQLRLNHLDGRGGHRVAQFSNTTGAGERATVNQTWRCSDSTKTRPQGEFLVGGRGEFDGALESTRGRSVVQSG
jgi:hypothetical protein